MLTCRAFLPRYYNEDGELVFLGRANMGVISLNLPRMAMESNGDKHILFSKIAEGIDLGIKTHLYKFNKIRKKKASSNPLFFIEGGCHMTVEPDDTIEEIIKTFSWSIGYIGLDETTYVMEGKRIHENNKLGIEILNYMKSKLDEYTEKHGLDFTLYSTPSESLCHTFITKDKKEFGVVEGVTDREYYTNSFHVNVREKIDFDEKQRVESELFHIPTAGRIVYNEFPHSTNFKAFEQSINLAMRLGLYYGINIQSDTCNDCGEHGEFNKCPKCGSMNITRINRACGYLSYYKVNGGTRYNKGKHQEITDRVDHFNDRKATVLA